ncbi:hypothetical protein [Streptomyces iconiensis]|uniref:Uncharacterized protein n=1 Tax=Streptomyces iconiensis TaxID=1384038 RepID=A0ABT7A2V9_9ACTN|nr:hypothetical protein [Streptomyces iconiensis]MDJ1135655.1 hypothetical protein [Streptomyces iconiensis]
MSEVEHLRKAAPLPNALLDLPADGETGRERLRRLVAIEAQSHKAELGAYGTMLARFPHPPAADLYLTLGRIVCDAGPKLRQVARALGMSDSQLVRWPPETGAYEFNSAMSWTALAGSQAAGALAAHTDMRVYYADCCALVSRLREVGAQVPEEFLDYYDDAADDTLCALALAVVQDGLDRGDDPRDAVFHARRIEEAIGAAWRTAAIDAAGPDTGTPHTVTPR